MICISYITKDLKSVERWFPLSEKHEAQELILKLQKRDIHPKVTINHGKDAGPN